VIFSITWYSLLFYPISYYCITLSLKSTASGKMIDLWRHSSYEIIQRSFRDSESDGELAMVILQEIWEHKGWLLIFPGAQIPCL
jgi:hypothetical protein